MYEEVKRENYTHVWYAAQVTGDLDVDLLRQRQGEKSIWITSGKLKDYKYNVDSGACIDSFKAGVEVGLESVSKDLAEIILKETKGSTVGKVKLQDVSVDLKEKTKVPYTAKGKFEINALIEILTQNAACKMTIL